jgi:hypothetical protein
MDKVEASSVWSLFRRHRPLLRRERGVQQCIEQAAAH